MTFVIDEAAFTYKFHEEDGSFMIPLGPPSVTKLPRRPLNYFCNAHDDHSKARGKGWTVTFALIVFVDLKL